MRTLVVLLIALGGARAEAQPPADPTPGPAWRLDLSVSNLFDGNINHDPEPVRSYGFVPGAELRYESSVEPAFVFGYDIAANQFTGTDEWDRLSHGLFGLVTSRVGKRLRFESAAQATWKGSSEDRELSNEFGVSERMLVRLSAATRVAIGGAVRYKQYPDDPGTSGLSPVVSVKVDQRFTGDVRLTLGYKYQTRHSRSVRDRYTRRAYTAELTLPVTRSKGELSVGVELRPQVYDRLIKVDGRQMLRRDWRTIAGATYERSVSARMLLVWQGGVEYRQSNDPDKRFFAPTFGLTLLYHWR